MYRDSDKIIKYLKILGKIESEVGRYLSKNEKGNDQTLDFSIMVNKDNLIQV